MQYLVGKKGKPDKLNMPRTWLIYFLLTVSSVITQAQATAIQNITPKHYSNAVTKSAPELRFDEDRQYSTIPSPSTCSEYGSNNGTVSFWEGGLGLYVYRPSGVGKADQRFTAESSALEALFIDNQNRLREDTDQNGRLNHNDAIVIFEKSGQKGGVVAQRFKLNKNGLRGDKLGQNVFAQHLKSIWNTHSSVIEARNTSIEQRHYQSAARAGRFIFSAIDSDNDGYVTGDKTTFPFVLDSFQGKTAQLLAETAEQTAQIVKIVRGTTETINPKKQKTHKQGVQASQRNFRTNISPLIVKAPSSDYDITFSDASYREFRKHFRNRRTMVYSMADNGLLQGVNAGFVDAKNLQFDASDHPLGSELWAYLPSSFLPHIQIIAGINNTANTYVDGKLYTFDVNIFEKNNDHPGGWGTILVAGVRLLKAPQESELTKAEENILQSTWIVMDITNPDKPPRLVAEIANTAFATNKHVDLVKARSNQASLNETDSGHNRWLLTFGSANSDQDTSAKLFLYDLKKGSLEELDTGVENSSIAGLTATDWNRNFVDDVIYYTLAGNKDNVGAGQLRRAVITFSSKGISLDDSVMLDGTGQDFITVPYTRMDADYNYWVFAATGRNNNVVDDYGTTQNTLYGIKEIVDESGRLTNRAIDRDRLISVDDIQTFDNGDVRTLNGSPVLLNGRVVDTVEDVTQVVEKYAGWSLNFYHENASPTGQIHQYGSSLLLTTFHRTQNNCSESLGVTYLYQRNLFNGLSPVYSAFKDSNKIVADENDHYKAIPEVILIGDNFYELINDEGFVYGQDGEFKKIDLGKPRVRSRRESWRELDKSWL